MLVEPRNAATASHGPVSRKADSLALYYSTLYEC